MAGIRRKKPVFPIFQPLRDYLLEARREVNVPIGYRDLLRYSSSITLFDKEGNDTMWETMIYAPSDRDYIYECLLILYAHLKVGGDTSFINHLYIDRVDLCLYGNTRPIRIRVVNKLNDLFDYFYVKTADASRIYGMEIEHMLSPNKINFLTIGNTVVEEHIQGVPGDVFIDAYLPINTYNPLRISKEFVKFNERCLVQLLGDMRNDNYVVEIIPDFDEIYFRIRAIDFDQQSFEGNYLLYLPQFFKENNPIINLGFKAMSPTLELQYQKEERSRILMRLKAARKEMDTLLDAMSRDEISTDGHITRLRQDLASLYHEDSFLRCKNMGEILKNSLALLEKYPIRNRQKARFRETLAKE